MRKISLLITITLFLTSMYSGLVYSDAEKMGASVIVVIDPHLILTESKAAKSINEQIEKKRKEYQNQISLQEKELNKKKQDLEDLQGKVSEAELSKKAQDYNVEAAKLQRSVQDKRIQMDQAYRTALTEIEKVVASILEKLANEKGYNMVMSSTSTMYSSPRLNITQEVMKSLDNLLPKVNVLIK
jgi:outer membrane protein